MKKVTITIVFLVLSVITLHAQKYSPIRHGKSVSHTQAPKAKRLINGILSRQNRVAARNTDRKTTEIAERLIAASDYNITDTTQPFGMLDTAIYTYSLSHYSIFDYNHMTYNSVIELGGSSPIGFGPFVGFPDPNNEFSILFDSTFSWSVYYVPGVIDTLIPNDVQYALYDTNYNVTEWVDLGTGLDSSSAYTENSFINTYDTNANIATSLELSWNYGAWDTDEYRLIVEAGDQQVLLDSNNYYYGGGIWTPAENWYYTYDASGNMITAIAFDDSMGIWLETEQIFMRYNTSNKLTWDSIAQYNSGVWTPSGNDTFIYTPGLFYFTTWISYSFGYDSAVTSFFVWNKHINSSNLPDTLWTYDYYPDSTIISATKNSFQYDGYEEPTIANGYNFNIDTPSYLTGWFDSTIDNITYFYYQTYDVGRHTHTAVPSVPTLTGTVTVFPNPTTGTLYITRANYTTGAYTALTLTNALGQRVRSETLPWLSATESMSLQGLPAGVYWLTVADGAGHVLCRQEVVSF